jgi:hypothetical protein
MGKEASMDGSRTWGARFSLARPAPETRWLAAAFAVIWGTIAIGLGFRQPWATWIWPFADGRLLYIFLASIAAAVAAPLAWLALVDEPAALAGIAADGIAIGAGLTIALVSLGIARGDSRLLIYAAGAAGSAMVAIAIFRAAHAWPIRDRTPAPRLVRFAFAVFVAVLLAVAGSLILRIKGVFPWDLPSGTGALVGVMFLGAAAYFAYGFWRNAWAHAGGQLIGFLAYDAVLAIPYLEAFRGRNQSTTATDMYGYAITSSANQVHALSLALYLGVIFLSAAIAVYYLFIHGPTRIDRRLRAQLPAFAPE